MNFRFAGLQWCCSNVPVLPAPFLEASFPSLATADRRLGWYFSARAFSSGTPLTWSYQRTACGSFPAFLRPSHCKVPAVQNHPAHQLLSISAMPAEAYTRLQCSASAPNIGMHMSTCRMAGGEFEGSLTQGTIWTLLMTRERHVGSIV